MWCDSTWVAVPNLMVYKWLLANEPQTRLTPLVLW